MCGHELGGVVTGTEIVVCALADPAALVAVSVYVVVCDGDTVVEFIILLLETAPIPPIDTEVALLTDHVSCVADWPSCSTGCKEVNELIVG
jgi:hypothetical protein